MSESKFYICEHCGNIIGMIHSSGVPIICCGEKMKLLEANTTDASQEKHVPAVEVEGNSIKVQIGSALHPSIDTHYIEWIYLMTDKGGMRRALQPGEEPKAVFTVQQDEKPLAVFAYCNLHGLWKKDI